MKKYLTIIVTDTKPNSGHVFLIPEYRDKLLWHGIFFTELFKKIYRLVRGASFS